MIGILDAKAFEFFFKNKDYLSEKIDENLALQSSSDYDWKLALENHIILPDCQLWDLATNKKIEFNDLDEKLLAPNSFAIKLWFWRPWKDINVTFHFNVVEQTDSEMKDLIDNCDYDRNGFFNWFFMMRNFKKVFHGIALDQFHNIFQDFLTKDYLFYLKELWYFLDFHKKDSECPSDGLYVTSFKISTIRHNDQKLAQTDLDQPGELNLTFDYQYLINGEKTISGTIKNPIKVILIDPFKSE